MSEESIRQLAEHKLQKPLFFDFFRILCFSFHKNML